MKKIIFSSLIAMGLVFTGCSTKIPMPVNAQWDNESAISINNSLVFTKSYKVPKDSYLSNTNFTYQVIAQKKGIYLFENEQIAKTFLVAHNANKIIIIGKKDLVTEYKNYFLKNGVSAEIVEQSLSPIDKDINFVNILFFNKVKEIK